jgi:2-haloacid dehalogenase
MRTAILSNGTAQMLQSAIGSAQIGDLIDAVLSVDAVEVFKPHPRVYQLVLAHFDVAPDEVLFHSSNAWDAAAAGAFGFRVCWINRTRQPREYAFTTIEAELPDLTSVPDTIRTLRAG